MALGKRPVDDGLLNGGAPISDSDPWVLTFPVLLEFLTATSWEDGQKRVPGTFSAFTQDAVFKICLNDRDLKRHCFISGSSFHTCLSKLDRGLEHGDLDWRSDGKPYQRK